MFLVFKGSSTLKHTHKVSGSITKAKIKMSFILN